MNILQLNHDALLVKDVERSRHFYSQVLGLEEVARPSNFNFPGAWFTVGSNQQIHLVEEEEEGRAAVVHPGYRRDELAHGHASHMAFKVDNLDEALRYLQQRNVEIMGGPRPRGDGVQQMYICDPDGYVLEIFAWQKP